MKRIRILEPNIANKIAAGEVVERPASVVKELVENSIDAGSTAVTIEIRNGGIDYIRITDNGSGIAEGDTEKAFLRHATSKLNSASDLDHIETLGFRGEALASIAAVSKLTMRTRTADGDYGTILRIEGGATVSKEPCGCPCGTTIEVSELFYNVPARLKFLKSPRGEAAMIGDYVLRLILSNPSIAIKFINNGKTVYHSAGDGSLENALFCVYGNEISSRLYAIDYDDGYLKLSGYVGSETLAKNTRIQQSLFVNHRYIKSPTVSFGVQRAFDTRLMHGKFPFFVIDMLISSYEVDVNVHPNKLSVRFKDDERIGFAVTRAINDALRGIGDTDGGFETKQDDEKVTQDRLYVLFGNNETENVSADQQSDIRLTPVVRMDDNTSADSSSEIIPHKPIVTTTERSKPIVFRDSASGSIPAFSHSSSGFQGRANPDIPVFDFSSCEERKNRIAKPEQIELCSSPYTIIGSAFDTYIIVQQGDAIYYIDQHAAHERMLYEKMIRDELRFDSQILLVPEYIHLDPISFQVLNDNIRRFEELGFSLEPVSETTVRIDAVPAVISSNSESFISDAVALIQRNGKVDEIDMVRSSLIQAACKKAVKAGDRLEEAEIVEILEAYMNDSTPMTCPHGRPVIVRVTKTELQKLFKRIE